MLRGVKLIVVSVGLTFDCRVLGQLGEGVLVLLCLYLCGLAVDSTKVDPDGHNLRDGII